MSAQPTAIRAVVFDMDDTLYPERDYVRSGYRAVAEDLRGRLGRSDRFEDWLWRRFCAGEAGRAFDALDAEFSLGLSAAQITGLVGVYRCHRPDIHARSGVVELLGRLGGTSRLGLLSDGYLPAQQWKLDALGLGPFLDAVVFTEAMGRECWKPSPAGYDAVRAKLDVPHEACAYVGDNPAKDFLAPNRLGWRTVCLRCGGQVHADNPSPEGGAAQLTIASLADLGPALGLAC